MKTIFKTTVNGIELRFTIGGLNLDPAHNLEDPAVRVVYCFGQRLHPFIVHLKKFQGCPYPDDVEDYVAQFMPNQQEAALSILTWAKREFYEKAFNQIGYVYLIRNDHGLYKIGKTKQLERRLKRFDVKLPFEIETIVIIQTAYPDQEEKDWHTRFADKRIDGEWFSLDDADVQWMTQYDVRYTIPPDETPTETPNPTSHLWEFGDRSNG